MNPYLEQKNRLNRIDAEIELLEKERKEAVKEIDKKLKKLGDERHEIKKSCTHKDASGKSTWQYDGQDPGSGRSEHTCTLCYASD